MPVFLRVTPRLDLATPDATFLRPGELLEIRFLDERAGVARLEEGRCDAFLAAFFATFFAVFFTMGARLRCFAPDTALFFVVFADRAAFVTFLLFAVAFFDAIRTLFALPPRSCPLPDVGGLAAAAPLTDLPLRADSFLSLLLAAAPLAADSSGTDAGFGRGNLGRLRFGSIAMRGKSERLNAKTRGPSRKTASNFVSLTTWLTYPSPNVG